MSARLGILILLALLSSTIPAAASGHREAPLTALDPAADITDVFAFAGTVPGSVTLVMCVHPFLEPGNGPQWTPFDPSVLYELHVDNDHDALADVSFQFSFETEQRLPDAYQAFLGVGTGVAAPGNSPPPVAPGTPIVPPRIASFEDAGFGLRQRYTVAMVVTAGKKKTRTVISPADTPLYAVPANVGPRTMEHAALTPAGIYVIDPGLAVFAGTTDDPSFADLGGLLDTFNTAKSPPILSPAEDASLVNLAADTLAGFAVNAIALEIPIGFLTSTGTIEPASAPAATIGVWATTSRAASTVRKALPKRGEPKPAKKPTRFRQVQRMGHPLVNQFLVGMAQKDRFSLDQPVNDARFLPLFLDPGVARIMNALFGGALAIAPPPRDDLRQLFQYREPVAAPGTPEGPVADMLRLNTGVPHNFGFENRLGRLGGDPAGYPNGRRPVDDVTDLFLRLVAGGVDAPDFPGKSPSIGGRLGDGVNVNDGFPRASFPYLADAPSGRSRRHIDPGEPGCTQGFGGACLP